MPPNLEEPVEGIQLRRILSQANLFLDNIEQVSLEDEEYNSLRTQAIILKCAAEEMLLIRKKSNKKKEKNEKNEKE